MNNLKTATNISPAEMRCLLFRTWQETGDVNFACNTANLSRGTFYYWKQRFHEGGYDGLRKVRSHAPKNPRRLAPHVADEIVALKQEMPHWGKARICKALNGRHGTSVASPNSVRRVLSDAGLW